MEVALSFVVSVFFAVAIYLMLSKHIIRILLGVSIFGNAVNLSIFTAGRLMREVPPIIPEALQTPEVATANPLPQALVPDGDRDLVLALRLPAGAGIPCLSGTGNGRHGRNARCRTRGRADAPAWILRHRWPLKRSIFPTQW